MKHLVVIAFVLVAQLAIGQKYFSKTGKITFYSKAPVETIDATNTSASTVIDISTGAMEWAVLIKGFKFEKALMEEHFNENYMESGTFPKAKFKGKIDNLNAVNFNKDGEYKVDVSGQLEVHGVTKPVNTKGTIVVKNGQISASSKFKILLTDYGIEIPKVVADNVSNEVEIDVQANYQVMNAVP